jgi:glucokinase
MDTHTILAGDLGATKTNLALFSSAKGTTEPLSEATFQSSDYEDLASIVHTFLSPFGRKIDLAVFGVAGPVVNGEARITNLNWLLSEEKLQNSCQLTKVVLMNDLVATANAIPYLASEDFFEIHKGRKEKKGAMAVIAPGTGLGEAFLVWDGNRYRAYPSEGGHVDFAPTDKIESELASFLQIRFSHVSYERLCSGKGLPNIYDFVKQTGLASEEEWVRKRLDSVDDPTPVIVEGALSAKKTCHLCKAVLRIFIRILGAEAGNLALKVLATGGVYLGGGIPPRILDAIVEDDIFVESFLRKGRMADMLAAIPVRVITNPKAALLGAAAYGLYQGAGDE